ncbi:AI-2E family transporter [Marivirga arenosa]|uniref:AI-2E family transporter n=1 Tax=Marivirga arenosa TaxID=3059076 RepID=A0AA51RB00_9BACT|nr:MULTISPECIES: AI-2E family transporter [unclassified Marivirga]WKK82009.2 AI-2E family transporter [Marivirga sp. BKB1-2]WMN07388.1 AI-2E family transporter [Marivirga sp. ABR2-2]
MKLNDQSTTNKLLLVLVIPVIFYSLQLLSFIFIPLMFAIFIALLFTPMMRWMKKRKVPQIIALGTVVLILTFTGFSTIKIVQMSGKQIQDGKSEIFRKLDHKVEQVVTPFAETLGLDQQNGGSTLKSLMKSDRIESLILDNFTITISFIQSTVVNILMTLFFLMLLLAGSLNFKDILQSTLFSGGTQSVKTFMKVERSVSDFLKVKIFVSLLTGIAFGIIAWSLGISFPLFWGLLAFVINFVQMVGSVISTVLVMLFAFIEIDNPGTLLLAAILFTGAQVLFGAVLEPIFMGKSFSINIIIVLIMLMFWGFIWGVPGLILSIPLTVLLKTILNEFPSGKKFAKLMS